MIMLLCAAHTALPGIPCACMSRWKMTWRDHVSEPKRLATVIGAWQSAERCSRGKTLAILLRQPRIDHFP
jgi:hypothetical protein